jgi:hypothetical protein
MKEALTRDAYKLLVSKSEGKGPLAKFERKWNYTRPLKMDIMRA